MRKFRKSPSALTDEGLARLAIAATAIAPRARGRWLQRLAAQLDPPARRNTRQARWRAAPDRADYCQRGAAPVALSIRELQCRRGPATSFLPQDIECT